MKFKSLSMAIAISITSGLTSIAMAKDPKTKPIIAQWPVEKPVAQSSIFIDEGKSVEDMMESTRQQYLALFNRRHIDHTSSEYLWYEKQRLLAEYNAYVAYEASLSPNPGNVGKISYQNVVDAFKDHTDEEMRQVVRNAMQEAHSRLVSITDNTPQPWITTTREYYWKSVIRDFTTLLSAYRNIEDRSHDLRGSKVSPSSFSSEAAMNTEIENSISIYTRAQLAKAFVVFKVYALFDNTKAFTFAHSREMLYEAVNQITHGLLANERLEIDYQRASAKIPSSVKVSTASGEKFISEISPDSIINFFMSAPKAIANKSYLKGTMKKASCQGIF